MEWLQSFLVWYIYLFLLGLVFLPIAQRIFSRTIDGGYAFAKIIGIIVMTYAMMLLGILKLVPFTRMSLFGLLAVIAFASYRRIFKGDVLGKLAQNSSKLNWMVIEEILFFLGLLAWAIVRGQEPSVHGLEKFMDYGFMQSIGRSLYFPPLDMWYGPDALASAKGYFINYYYFGHLSGALLIKLTDVYAPIGYNLILANLLGLGMSAVFSIIINVISYAGRQMKLVGATSARKLILYGVLGALLLNIAGNAHTLYIFTKGYPNEAPLPPWDKSVVPDADLFKAMSRTFPDILTGLADYSKYWYPNATRFIPNTIHEFPAYSYIVADLHGHVFDIPFVLLTYAVILLVVVPILAKKYFGHEDDDNTLVRSSDTLSAGMKRAWDHPTLKYLSDWWKRCLQAHVPLSIFFGFMTAVHYMTNAFDGPIYILLALVVLFLIHRFSSDFFFNVIILIFSFLYFSAPFSIFFEPFVSGVGVNCGFPLVAKLAKAATMYKLGPFLFEKGNCQNSAVYQLVILWGHFWIHGILLAITLWTARKVKHFNSITATSLVMSVFFGFGTMLILIPEFFYIKDIYPTHFRANTMFKLGYQAYMMMTIASVYTLWRLKHSPVRWFRIASRVLSLTFIILVLVYMRFGVLAYYGNLKKPVKLDGIAWLKDQYPETHEIVEYFNTKVSGQPVILEAQGDSYTDYNVVSAYTGLPTVAGWWVHEWLWRGTSDIVGKRIPDIENLYRSDDLELTRSLLRRYKISYVVVSELERKKYNVGEQKINEEKFAKFGREVFRSVNGKGVVYAINQ